MSPGDDQQGRTLDPGVKAHGIDQTVSTPCLQLCKERLLRSFLRFHLTNFHLERIRAMASLYQRRASERLQLINRKMKPILKIIAFGIISILLPISVRAEDIPAGKNVLLIVADDLNINVGCYGNPDVQGANTDNGGLGGTPNIDQLAKMGVLFKNAHVQYAVCNPSRASFLSGLYPQTTGVYNNRQALRTSPKGNPLGNIVTLQQYFDNHGYFTARVGKIAHEAEKINFAGEYQWDLEVPVAGRVDLNVPPVPNPAPIPQYTSMKENGTGAVVAGASWNATSTKDKDTKDWRSAHYVANLLAAHSTEPFFIALGFHSPHLPWVTPRPYFNWYTNGEYCDIRLPTERLGLRQEPVNDRDDIPAYGISTGVNGKESEYLNDFFKMSPAQACQGIAAYNASVSSMDNALGLVLQQLTALNLWENTIVVFMGDNGFHLGEHGGLFHKATLFSESTQVPLIIASPGGVKEQICRHPVELVGLYPTLAELAGLPAPIGVQGTSFAQYQANPNAGAISPAYTVCNAYKKSPIGKDILGRSIRTDRYRYTKWADGGPTSNENTELYDLDTDPGEFNNLIVENYTSNPPLRALVSNLHTQLMAASRRATDQTKRGVQP